MDSLDEILDRYIMVKPEELEKALTNVAKTFNEHYACKDGYTVIYNAASGQALYYFLGYENDPLAMTISPEQRNYLVSTNYWQRV